MSLDQFYTNPELAERLFNSLKDEKPDIWLEPSAGTGSFYNLMPEGNRLGYDLEPKCSGVVQQDFLTVTLPDSKIIAVGNPPFGYRAQGAIEFFNACAKQCYKIAFIIPRSFRKAYIINQLNPCFHLVEEEVLDVGVFIGGAEKIRTAWQVWEHQSEKREKIVLPRSHPSFNIVSQGAGFDRHKADIAIRRTGYKSVGEVVFPEDANPITQYIFIQILEEEAIEIFENLDLSCAFDTALAPTVTQGEIIKAYLAQEALAEQS